MHPTGQTMLLAPLYFAKWFCKKEHEKAREVGQA